MGSTTELTDTAGVITSTRAYTAWGLITEQSGDDVNTCQFIGRGGYCLDTDNTYIVRRRAYSASTCRWLSTDPVRFPIANAYQYASNRPLFAYDPSGMVDVLFDPENTAGVEWYDNDKLEWPELGRTSCRIKLLPDCTECCEPKKYEMRLGIDVACTIQLNRKAIEAARRAGLKDPKGNPISLEGSYGHEQLHIDNWRRAIDILRSQLANNTRDLGCVDAFTCIDAAKGRVAYAEGIINELRQLSKEHDRDVLPVPESGVMYPPLGGNMPREPAKGQ
jgi:RHS repeat-associated protein